MAEERAGELIKTHDGPSSSSSAAPGFEYQVFLSFRGVDTRKTFTDHLYSNLTGAGIRTFRDNEDLRVGKVIRPDLLKAIEESTISIPIFSKGYASSEWCLMELTHMVKCMNSDHGHTICPIFYDVNPSDVRHQRESFHEAFLQHTEKFVEPIVQEWKEALKQVADIKGWEKDKFKDGYEGKLVEKIVSDVCMKLKKGNVYLTDDLVGMDHHREEMTKLLDLDSSNAVRIVGIVGMGGIGKTTIATYMYNQLCDHFQHQCSFLEDVREKVKRNNGSAELQKQLISDVLKRSVDGIFALDIRNTFRHKKVLIVLDDVEDRSQLKEIIGGLENFGSGCRIIVTTRNKDVFIEKEGDLIYAPCEMNFEDSLLLFYKHAFRSTQPREGYEEISREVVQTAAGLPLSLVVIGSLLSAKEKIIWEAKLKELRTIPAHKVQERLKISYETLNHRQKQIFLDIACHFIGQDKTYPLYMWDDYGFFPESGTDVLISLSLITIGKDNIFRMHDQLRDLGRDIVYHESPSDPVQRSRLWSWEEAQEVLDSQSETKKIQTFSVNYRSGSDCIFSNDDFKGMSRLRYLSLEGSILKGDFKGLVSNLRWFRWRFEDSTDLVWSRFGFGKSRMRITNFCANKLVILDLSCSWSIRDGWESEIQIKAATNLKVLNLSGCRYLTKLPECLWNMKSLVELDLSDTVITELSEQGMGNLTNLIKLILSFSKIKMLPDGIGKLEKLQVLNCSECRSLEGQLPSGIGRLSSLRVLDLSCTKVDKLFEDIGSLCYLRKLNLRGTCIKKLPGVGIERLQHLEELDCGECSLDGEVPEEIWSLLSLRVLKLSHSKIIGGIPKDISGLSKLETLELRYREKLQLPIEGLKLPLSLTRVQIPLTEASLKGVRGLVNLRELEFHKNVGCRCELTEEVVAGVVDHNNSNNGTPIVDMLSNLERLSLVGLDDHVMSCRLLPAMKFDSSPRLITLEISSCTFGTLPVGSLDLSICQMLRLLSISGCPVMREIKGLEFLTSETLIVSNCPLLVQPDVSNCQMLKELVIFDCPVMREIKGIEVLTSLERLTLKNCPLLLWPDLSNCQMLTLLSIYDCLVMREIKGIEFLTSLEKLTLWNCPLLLRPDLLNCQMLKELSISFCPVIREIKGLEVLTSLEKLTVSSCPLLLLPGLSNCRMLKELIISDCGNMREIKGLEVLTSLENLRVCYCPKLKQPDLSNLKGLKFIEWNEVNDCKLFRHWCERAIIFSVAVVVGLLGVAVVLDFLKSI